MRFRRSTFDAKLADEMMLRSSRGDAHQHSNVTSYAGGSFSIPRNYLRDMCTAVRRSFEAGETPTLQESVADTVSVDDDTGAVVVTARSKHVGNTYCGKKPCGLPPVYMDLDDKGDGSDERPFLWSSRDPSVTGGVAPDWDRMRAIAGKISQFVSSSIMPDVPASLKENSVQSGMSEEELAIESPHMCVVFVAAPRDKVAPNKDFGASYTGYTSSPGMHIVFPNVYLPQDVQESMRESLVSIAERADPGDALHGMGPAVDVECRGLKLPLCSTATRCKECVSVGDFKRLVKQGKIDESGEVIDAGDARDGARTVRAVNDCGACEATGYTVGKTCYVPWLVILNGKVHKGVTREARRWRNVSDMAFNCMLTTEVMRIAPFVTIPSWFARHVSATSKGPTKGVSLDDMVEASGWRPRDHDGGVETEGSSTDVVYVDKSLSDGIKKEIRKGNNMVSDCMTPSSHPSIVSAAEAAIREMGRSVFAEHGGGNPWSMLQVTRIIRIDSKTGDDGDGGDGGARRVRCKTAYIVSVKGLGSTACITNTLKNHTKTMIFFRINPRVMVQSCFSTTCVAVRKKATRERSSMSGYAAARPINIAPTPTSLCALMFPDSEEGKAAISAGGGLQGKDAIRKKRKQTDLSDIIVKGAKTPRLD